MGESNQKDKLLVQTKIFKSLRNEQLWKILVLKVKVEVKPWRRLKIWLRSFKWAPLLHSAEWLPTLHPWDRKIEILWSGTPSEVEGRGTHAEGGVKEYNTGRDWCWNPHLISWLGSQNTGRRLEDLYLQNPTNLQQIN